MKNKIVHNVTRSVFNFTYTSKISIYNFFLTQSGHILDRADPINLPHADPINKEGIKRPLDIDRPKVAAARKKYRMTKTASVMSL